MTEDRENVRNEAEPRDDSTLHDVWKRFAVYDLNAVRAQKRLMRPRLWMLVLGVLATTLAVIYSQLEPAQRPDWTQWRFYLWVSVLLAPIGASVLEGAADKSGRGLN